MKVDPREWTDLECTCCGCGIDAYITIDLNKSLCGDILCECCFQEMAFPDEDEDDE